MKFNGKEYPTPTLDQAAASWVVINNLISLGYPHNFQGERQDLVNYLYALSGIIDNAYEIKKGIKEE